MRLSGNTILITGGSSGIGLAMARKLIALNNQVLITGRDVEKLKVVKKELPQLDYFACDLTVKSAVDALVFYVEQTYSGLNMLINNAAVQYNYSFTEEMNLPEKIEYEVAANFTAPVKLTAMLLPILLNNSNSAVVNVSSGLFIAPKQSASVYCATKAGMHSYSKTLRYQLEEKGIKVFEIIPSLIETPMTEGRGTRKITPEALVEEFLKNFKSGRTEIYIGKTKLLKIIHRLSPRMSDRIMRKGV